MRASNMWERALGCESVSRHEKMREFQGVRKLQVYEREEVGGYAGASLPGMFKNLMNTLESEILKTNNTSIFPDVLLSSSWELAQPSTPIDWFHAYSVCRLGCHHFPNSANTLFYKAHHTYFFIESFESITNSWKLHLIWGLSHWEWALPRAKYKRPTSLLQLW